MRGRLIFSFLAEIRRLDTEATVYDDDFKEPLLIDSDDDGLGESCRSELPPVRIPCQVETELIDQTQAMPSGNVPRSRLNLVFHFRDLERLELVDEQTGRALIKPGDRLEAIYDRRGRLVQTFPNPPGLFVDEARPIGFGLGFRHPKRNLLLVSLSDREQAWRNG